MPRLKPVLISFAAFLAILVVTHAATFPGSLQHLMQVTHAQPILDLKPSFSSVETYQRLQDFGADGRLAYLQTMLTIDTIFPLSAFVFLFLLGRYAANRLGLHTGPARMLKMLSVAYLALDFLENLTVVVLLVNFPDRIDVLAANIGFLSVGKRMSMFAAFGLPLFLLSTAAVIQRLRPAVSAPSLPGAKLGSRGQRADIYAHLQPGRVGVRPGENVAARQEIGRLGSSGNSTEPHLHSQVCDRPSGRSCAGVVPTFEAMEVLNADGPRPLQTGDVVRVAQ